MVASHRLFRNFFLLFASNVLGQLMFFIGLVHLARILGPASFGIWNLAQAWMLYLLRAVDLGLEVVGIRSAVEEPGQLNRIVWDVVGTRMLFAVLLLAILLLAIWSGWLPSAAVTLLFIFAFTMFPVAIILEWVYEAHQSVAVVSAARILRGFLFSALIVFLINRPDQINIGAGYYVLSYSVASVFVFISVYRRFGLSPPSYDRLHARSLLRQSLPLGLSILLSQYVLFIGTIILGYTAAQDTLGYYTAAHRLIIFLWAYGIVASNRVLLPQLTKLFHESKVQFSGFVRSALRVVALLSFPIVIVFISAGQHIIAVLYGAQYDRSALPFEILTLALFLAILRSVIEISLIATGRQVVLLKGMMFLAVLYTLMTIAFSIEWGIAGVAWAAALSEFIFTVSLFIIFRELTLAEIIGVVWKPVAAGVLSMSILFVFGIHSLLFVGLLGLAIYAGILSVTKQIDRTDFFVLFNAVGWRFRNTPAG